MHLIHLLNSKTILEPVSVYNTYNICCINPFLSQKCHMELAALSMNFASLTSLLDSPPQSWVERVT